MQRPLEKRVGPGLDWRMAVREMSHVSGVRYPVFEWSFGGEDGLRGGELRVWPLQGMLIFQDRRQSTDWKFQSIEKALAKINEYGWGEPPHIDEIFQDAITAHQKLQVEGVGSREEVEQIFQTLRAKWMILVDA